MLIGASLASQYAVNAQPATPTPTPEPDTMVGGYRATGSTEFGFRWRSVDGNLNKYQSDLNYKQGFRFFDGNILFESDSGKGKYFDSLLFTNSGWGADPTGFTRVNMEKTGSYRFNADVRRVKYFNNLQNHALNEHNSNTTHTFGDFDFVYHPQDERFRVKAGASFSGNNGPGTTTTRAYSDEFRVDTLTRTKTQDWRFGIEGKLGGFDYGLTQGFRIFDDHSSYSSTAPNPGNNPANTSALATFFRSFPTEGHAYFTQGFLHRTFEQKLDFTARLIYSSTNSRMTLDEQITGRDNANNVVILDQFIITSDAKRPQTRGDFALTYTVTDKFRLSNTFSFDLFAVNGGERFYEALFRRNNAGNPLATVITSSVGYRVNDYQRFVNTFEGDYQVNSSFGFHLGYRFTHRDVEITGFDQTLTSPPSGTNPLIIAEERSNGTHTFIAGLKAKPTKNWVIFADIEHGEADNVFTRVENYQFTNFRVRSRLTVDKFTFNISAITKDNQNPSNTITVPSPIDFTTNVKSRYYSGSVDWTPIQELSISGGYTYRHLTSYTPIILPVSGQQLLGFSQFFSRDHYGFIDVSANPIPRLTLYGSYRLSRDKGQGDRVSTVIQNIIGSYPMRFATPEFRAAIRVTDHIDWSVGYQYYGYDDIQTPTQNYNAHLPYTSIRIFWGRNAAAR
jgi:hypothetical protein